MDYLTHNEAETEALGARLAAALSPGAVVAYRGDLGAGKTAFTKGLARALGVKETVTSPTFTFMKSYKGRLTLYHYDMYRVTSADELYELGLEEHLKEEGGVCAIEWNKFENLSDPIVVTIGGAGDMPREINVEGIKL